MPGIELQPPIAEIISDLNLKMKIRITAQVILDLSEICGAFDCDEPIEKGIIEHPIIKDIIISLIDDNGIIRSEIMFCIDWERLELSAQTDEGSIILDRLDMQSLLAPQLDPILYQELSSFVKRLHKKYNIIKTIPTYIYRERYTETAEIHQKTRDYMGQEPSDLHEKYTRDLNYELRTAFSGLERWLNVAIRK